MDKINLVVGALFLEDDPDTQDDIKDLCKEYDLHNYIIESDPDKFLQIVDGSIAVCGIDHYLTAGTTGLKVVRELRAKSKQSFIIVTTGLREVNRIIEYINEGINAWVDKNSPDYKINLTQALRKGFHEAKERLDIENERTRLRAELQGRMKGTNELINKLERKWNY